MYIQDVHIIYYVAVAILGIFVGLFTDWMVKRLTEEKKIFSMDIFKKFKTDFKPNYIIMLITVVIYVTLLYVLGVKDTLIGNLDLIKFLIITPILIAACIIDYKYQIIPNRLNLTLFEIGIGFVFLYGLSDFAISINMILGMFAGAGIFLLITLLGGLIYGKDAMGFGDVKLMGALGLFFGLSSIIVVTLIAFLLGAVISIILLVTKIKKTNEYIPFGPFIVLAAFINMYVPFEVLKNILMTMFTLGLWKG